MTTQSLSVTETVRRFIVENFLFGQDDIPLGDEDSFLEKGLIDSTGVLELIQFLEEGFRIEVADEEMVPENLDSILKLTHFIDSKSAEPGIVR